MLHLYIIMVCIDGVTLGMCQYELFPATEMVCYWLIVYCLWFASV